MVPGTSEWRIWRHPQPRGVQGRCIGHTDVLVDPRKAKRLAHRIRQEARRQGLPQVIYTSDLVRGKAVGRWLQQWGWTHHVVPALAEVSFGAWDGRLWSDIPVSEIDAWCGDFAHATPGGGESVAQLLQRVASVLFQKGSETGPVVMAVGHAGWLSAAQWLQRHGESSPMPWPQTHEWPRALRYGQKWQILPQTEGVAFSDGCLNRHA